MTKKELEEAIEKYKAEIRSLRARIGGMTKEKNRLAKKYKEMERFFIEKLENFHKSSIDDESRSFRRLETILNFNNSGFFGRIKFLFKKIPVD